MADIIVTVPKTFTHPSAPGKKGLAAWLAEGDQPGSPWSGTEWGFSCGVTKPKIEPGERVYVCCEGCLVGYAPLIRLDRTSPPNLRWLLIRGGGAVSCTIARPVPGFMGWRYRFWDRSEEYDIKARMVTIGSKEAL